MIDPAERAPADPTAGWESNPRPLLIIDETRLPREGCGEHVSFAVLATTTAIACEFERHAREIRSRLPAQTADANLKGRMLFGVWRPAHEAMRQHVLDCLAHVREAAILTTTTTATRSVPASLETVSSVGERKQLRGAELAAVLHLVDACIGRWNLGPEVVVVVDRSRQLGLSKKQRGLAPDEIEVLEYEGSATQIRLNAPDYAGPNVVVRIFVVPDQGLFRDLLLLPDALAYVARESALLPAAQKRAAVTTGFWFDWLNLEPWAARRRARTSKP